MLILHGKYLANLLGKQQVNLDEQLQHEVQVSCTYLHSSFEEESAFEQPSRDHL